MLQIVRQKSRIICEMRCEYDSSQSERRYGIKHSLWNHPKKLPAENFVLFFTALKSVCESFTEQHCLIAQIRDSELIEFLSSTNKCNVTNSIVFYTIFVPHRILRIHEAHELLRYAQFTCLTCDVFFPSSSSSFLSHSFSFSSCNSHMHTQTPTPVKFIIKC